MKTVERAIDFAQRINKCSCLTADVGTIKVVIDKIALINQIIADELQQGPKYYVVYDEEHSGVIVHLYTYGLFGECCRVAEY